MSHIPIEAHVTISAIITIVGFVAIGIWFIWQVEKIK
jgi:hypothetical protein